jgi:hypothetical protein
MTIIASAGRVAAVLLLYAALYSSARSYYDRFAQEQERGTTFWTIGGMWAVSTFIGNYLLFRAGVMSFIPWFYNFLHTFVWIGVVLTTLYLGVRRSQPLWQQMVLFATFSLVIKVAEHILFGTWELTHFLHVFKGNAAYILGWSLADGLYPPLTLFGLRLLAPRIPALVPV